MGLTVIGKCLAQRPVYEYCTKPLFGTSSCCPKPADLDPSNAPSAQVVDGREEMKESGSQSDLSKAVEASTLKIPKLKTPTAPPAPSIGSPSSVVTKQPIADVDSIPQ